MQNCKADIDKKKKKKKLQYLNVKLHPFVLLVIMMFVKYSTQQLPFT